MHLKERATELGSTLYTIEQALALLSPSELPTFLPDIFTEGHNSDLSARITDTDVLNTRLSLAALALLKRHPAGPVWPDLDLTYPPLLDALCSRAACRWEKYTVTTRLPVSATTTASAANTGDANGDLVARIAANPDELAIVSCSRKPNQGSRVFATPASTTATASAEVTKDHTSSISDKGLSSGEVEIEIEVVFDVGHNPAAIAALVERIKREYGGHNSDPSSRLEREIHWNVRMVYGVSRDKDAAACLAALLTVIPPQHIHFAQVHTHTIQARLLLLCSFFDP